MNFERSHIVLRRIFREIDGKDATNSINYVSNSAAGLGVIFRPISKALQGFASSLDLSTPKLISNLDGMSTMHPQEIAQVESLLANSLPAEDVLKAWSTLSTNGFEAYNNLLSHERVKRDDNFEILFHVRRLSGFPEAVKLIAGIPTNEALGEIDGFPVVFSVEVLLHKDASARDFFRSLIVATRGFHIWAQRSKPVGPLRAAALLTETTSSKQAQTIAPHLRELGKQIRSQALEYENQHGCKILQILSESEWDTNSFSFGSLRLRVEWNDLIEDNR